ncbi:hypothetical protein ABZ464_20115 [Streptomyces sp. NPDC005820]|uniref:hypothetical protein n=1 Tax=Streptomyces sp. NPDC005820 TaxID=3157069 RepID=UPI0033D02375
MGRIAIEEFQRTERAAAVQRSIENWKAARATDVPPEGMRLKSAQDEPAYSRMGDWKGDKPVPGTEDLVHSWLDQRGQPVQGNAYPHLHVIHDPYKGEVRVLIRRLKGPESTNVAKTPATEKVTLTGDLSGTRVNEEIERLAGILRETGPYR